MKLCLVGFHQRIDESLILVFVHWAVEVSGALFFGFAFIIARLHPRLGHVDAVEIDDWGDGIKKRQRIRAGVCCDGFAQITRGEGAGCDDPMAVGRQLFYLTVLNGNVWVCIYRVSHCLGKVIAIHSQCATGRKAMFVCSLHNQTIGLAHFPMEQTNRVLLIIVRAERVGTNHFPHQSRLMRKGFNFGPHFVDDHFNAHVCGLPCSL